ncbi:hypothetical protein B0H14DRAFT_2617734 [Mycena olivaceomarginata]|nr:hypothetical protein B0H14DRAFT_2617734 [Mycena olivaceomarginata]
MAVDSCTIPSNPDVSGIGVRAAIYAQNLTCFLPVIVHLWDGRISRDELKGIKDQSIGMLAALEVTKRSLATHAAVVLDLSWMNNTSTWIWFILYAHHRSKRDDRPTGANWSEWRDALLEPVRELLGQNDGPGTRTKVTSTVQRRRRRGIAERIWHVARRIAQRIWRIVQRIWGFVSEQPVLTLGSIHLSLMAAVGIWLWSDPSKFGQPLDLSCDPTLTVIGVPARFSSKPLRIISLAMYSLVLIPGLNLIPPFTFFLTLHISYNWSREQHKSFWTWWDSILKVLTPRRGSLSPDAEQGGRSQHSSTVASPNTNPLIPPPTLPFPSALQRTPNLEPHQIRNKAVLLNAPPQWSLGAAPKLNPLIPPPTLPFPLSLLFTHLLRQRSLGPIPDPELHQILNKLSKPALLNAPPAAVDRAVMQRRAPHTSFLIVGLVSLVAINILFITDIELTLRRNKGDQTGDEATWGFGQVLALLLLIIPLRDAWGALQDIWEKLEGVQEQFNEILRRECLATSVQVIEELGRLAKNGANPKATIHLAGTTFDNSSQLVTCYGKTELVQFLRTLGNGEDEPVPDVDYRKVLQSASASGHVLAVKALLRSGPLSTQELMDEVGGDYGTALCAACANGKFEVVNALLQAGARRNGDELLIGNTPNDADCTCTEGEL